MLERYREAIRRNAMAHEQELFATPEVWALGSHAHTVSRRALLLWLVLTGHMDWSRELGDVLYAALTDGAQCAFSVYRYSEEGCPEETPYLRAARAELVRRGLAPEYVERAREAYLSEGTPWGKLERWTAPGEVVLLVDASTLALSPEVAEACRRVAQRVRPEVGLLAGVTTGYELYDLGLWDEAERAAREVAGGLQALGARLVVADSAEAAYALRRICPELGVELGCEVVHVSQWLCGLGDGLPPWRYEGVVTLHDSSRLGRGLGVYDPPRELIRRTGAQLRELRYHREQALPSGPTFGYPYPEAVEAIARRRLVEVLETGVEAVITTSPYARRNLRLVAPGAELRVLDLVEWLQHCWEG
ncbi:protein of unknown function DUF224 cysteine-rich region domain protein [Thermobaculum terrenum ATCC BAA-798]|uniref:Uncharacterized protein n=1 Tax=Thermobaculum terrenum (strain ATCC BAA-798 / CCMEE 7001 / YNP1) TaxID=525904 RepID=D1CHX8_THET1|nr:(Fe-S)-binding protein [Thermobaculum terrenum]ACZ43349.1 protein of unknown function DUF224 cysteine-rich region domain protein [Thermobaculum terrenum ATCC BAA-798]